MKKQFIWKGHEVKIVNTWVDDDNRKKKVLQKESSKDVNIILRWQYCHPFFLMVAGSIVFIVFNASCFQPQIAV